MLADSNNCNKAIDIIWWRFGVGVELLLTVETSLKKKNKEYLSNWKTIIFFHVNLQMPNVEKFKTNNSVIKIGIYQNLKWDFVYYFSSFSSFLLILSASSKHVFNGEIQNQAKLWLRHWKKMQRPLCDTQKLREKLPFFILFSYFLAYSTSTSHN